MWTFKIHFALVIVFCVQVVFCYSADINSRSTDELTFVHIVSTQRNVNRNINKYHIFSFDCFIYQIYRHGDRNIVRSYPNDPFKNENTYWPEGFGQLTNVRQLIQWQRIYYRIKSIRRLESNRNSIWVFTYERGIIISLEMMAVTIETTFIFEALTLIEH